MSDIARVEFEERLISSFSKHVKSYDKHAHLQKSMAERLAILLPDTPPSRTLEIGCGTGIFTRHLLARNFQNLILNDIAPPMMEQLKNNLDLPRNTQYLIGNAETVKFPKVGLIAGNAVFQWLVSPDQSFQKMANALSKDGSLIFSTFGPDTLKELRTLGSMEGPAHLLSLKLIKDKLKKAGFKNIQIETENRQIFFENTRDLMRNLQQIGATPLRIKQTGELRQLIREYDRQFAHSNGVCTQWELFHCSAKRL